MPGTELRNGAKCESGCLKGFMRAACPVCPVGGPRCSRSAVHPRHSGIPSSGLTLRFRLQTQDGAHVARTLASHREGCRDPDKMLHQPGGQGLGSVSLAHSHLHERLRVLIPCVAHQPGELFAQAPYKPTKQNPNGGCEAVLDSSRYFVLTVIDVGSGQKAYIGMGFPERTESFDFNVACVMRLFYLPAQCLRFRSLTIDAPDSFRLHSLQDWTKRQSPPKLVPEAPTSSSSATSSAPTQPSRDFSLKAGETISIKLGGMSTKKKTDKPANGAGGGLGGFMLPPPPPPPSRGR